MDTKEIVLRKIASGKPIRLLPKSKVEIDGKIFHYRLDSFRSNGKYPFNINPNTLTADYEVWICGDESTFYVIPISEIKKIYSDPNTYTNRTPNQENIRTLDIHTSTNEVKFGSNKQINFTAYKNKTLSDFIISNNILPDQKQITEKKYGGGESEEHLNFKNWIANNPLAIGIENVVKTENDCHIFPSADRPDIIFSCTNNKYFIIEIEIENCLAGAFQAIKYKSLFCAENGLPLNSENVTSMLVARKITTDIKEFCTKYEVKIFEIPKNTP